ncbi:symplekin-like [Rhopilema esculentum]|uniref:symplekin-like n=1 Tax=Rhopilema esculentum TaxID=499914 RepID=UPI0031DD385D
MAKRSRLSEAHQFFEGEDAETQNADTDTTSERVIDLLNQAQLASTDNKITFLKQVQELIINKDPTLLDNFLDEILMFHQDKSQDVRKFVVGFVEEACKKDPVLLTQTIATVAYMLDDENVNVMKRVMLACVSLYKVAIQLVCKLRTIKEEIQVMWMGMSGLRQVISRLVKSENDGVRTHAIKFLEMVVLVHSPKMQDSDAPKKEGDVSLDIVPRNHPLVKLSTMREEGGKAIEALLSLCASPTISSVNLMAVITSLTNIAKQRPSFMSTVVQAFESLHANLPTTLAKSQVSSVRKNLKMQLFALLKQPAAAEFIPQIGTLLTDLGATQAELRKNLPKVNPDALKRSKAVAAPADPDGPEPKRVKTEPAEDGSSDVKKTGQSVVATINKAIEVTTKELLPKLTKEAVTDLVLVSMWFLPKTMPSNFQETFTPIAAAGGAAQVNHLARLLATQMTNAGIGPGIDYVKKMAEDEARMKKEEEEKASREPKSIPVIGSATEAEDPSKMSTDSQFKDGKSILDSSPDLGKIARQGETKAQEALHPRLRKIKQFKLQDVCRALNVDERMKMVNQAFDRILNAEQAAVKGGAKLERNKIIVNLVLQFGGDLAKALHSFIMKDFRSRYDLAMTWLYQQFIIEESKAPKSATRRDSKYSKILTDLLVELQKCLDPRDKLFTRFILEAPALSDSVVDFVKRYCEDDAKYLVGFATLRELITKCPAKKSTWMQLLLELTTRGKEQVRVQAIHSAKKLHSKQGLSEMIEKFALHSLQQLLRDNPPPQEQSTASFEVAPGEWTDDAIKACLYLYLALLPTNHKLFHNLAAVYTEASPLIKRTISRHLEHPVRAIGMNSPELLKLVENCPPGAETLVTKILHIITDKNPPTPELVERVKELYQKRVSDVRLLIPVLNGLDKQQVITVLPKLITQSPNVVKEVFNRLLGSFQPESATVSSPLTPSELLVALHGIECDIKAVMKAINLCFAEKKIYTQEVLAVVLQQLMEQSPLPTLFMRTVILSLNLCSRLVGFVMNILAKLINKQVWKQPKVWEGFVKCCQMTKPQSFPILLQLPPRQLESVFEISSELRDQLVAHVKSFTPHQRAHVPKSVQSIIERESNRAKKEDDEAEKEASGSPNPEKKRERGHSESLSDDSDSEVEKTSKRIKVKLDTSK